MPRGIRRNIININCVIIENHQAHFFLFKRKKDGRQNKNKLGRNKNIIVSGNPETIDVISPNIPITNIHHAAIFVFIGRLTFSIILCKLFSVGVNFILISDL